ncbi:MAG: adenylate/guanylate cyclase domain-containing protein [Deltaproteobacteria bacterium]|nr:adenylate/guanylate cyclase domain-containing protein [Deltaproteobacteria bacterium]
MGRLLIVTPEGQSERDLTVTSSVGRHPSNIIQLLDRIVSKEHCILELRNARWLLRDLGSLNGTYINGQRVSGEQWLNDGDEITLGNTRMVFRHPGAPEVAPAYNPGTSPYGPNAGAQQPAQPSYLLPQSPGPIQPPGWTPPSALFNPVANAAGYHPVPATVPAQQESTDTHRPVVAQRPGGMTMIGASVQAKVTIATNLVESHVRSKIAAAQLQFLPEKQVTDVESLRRDYEKLRVAYEVQRSIGGELNLDVLLEKILDRAFDLLAADRAAILLYDEDRELRPRAIRMRKGVDEPFVVSNTILSQVREEHIAVLSSDAMIDPRFSQAHSIIMQGIRSSMAVPLLFKNELQGVMIVDSQISTNAFGEKDLQLVTNIANQAALALANAQLARQIQHDAITRERFQRLLSPQVAQLVFDGKVEVKQGGDPRETTMFFSDIRGFTSMSEGMEAQDIVGMLNDYFERMVEIIFKYEGTLDKFVGDEIMALWGAPVSSADDPVRCVQASLEMIEGLKQFNLDRAAQGLQGFEIGIGINTGRVVAGYLGSSRAMQYTVIGAPVNLAARLCSQAKGMQIIISEETWLRVRDVFEVVELEPVRPKGIAQPVRIFQVLGRR